MTIHGCWGKKYVPEAQFPVGGGGGGGGGGGVVEWETWPGPCWQI